MFNLLWLATAGGPLLGLFLLERGAFALELGEFGYPVGASPSYLLHFVTMATTYLLVLRRFGPSRPQTPGERNTFRRIEFQRLSVTVLLLNGVMLLVLLMAGGALVLMREIDRGVFRSSFGGWGPLAYLSRDFLVPTSLALLTYVFVHTPRTSSNVALLLLNVLVVVTYALSWGYRAFAVLILIPAALIFFRRQSARLLIAAVMVAFLAVVLTTSYVENVDLPTALDVSVTRATVGSASTAWKLYELNRYSVEGLPAYAPTLLAVFGNRLGSLFGIEFSTFYDGFALHDFSTLITLTVKGFVPTVDTSTSNVTATVFGEGVMAFGSPGFLVFSVLAGVLLAGARRVFEDAYDRGQGVKAAIVATYCLTSIFSWINSGGITVLWLLPFVFNYVFTAILLSVFLRYCCGRSLGSAASSGSPRRRMTWSNQGVITRRHGHTVSR